MAAEASDRQSGAGNGGRVLRSVNPGVWVEAVLVVVLGLGYVAWFLRRHRASPGARAMVLEICVVVVLVVGIYFLVVWSER